MTDLLKQINQNSAAINLLFSLVVAWATVFYAILTNRLVKETTRMREVQTEPALSIWIEPSEHSINLINLVIENGGQGAARAIKLKPVPDFNRRKDKPSPVSDCSSTASSSLLHVSESGSFSRT